MGKKHNSPRPVKPSEMNKVKREVTRDATRQAFILMLCIPSMVIRDHFGKLNRLEIDGVSREARFVDMCMETYDAIQSEHVTYEDLIDTLNQETGVNLWQLSRKRDRRNHEV